MNIYKLKYPDKESAILDLLLKGVYVKDANDELIYGDGIHAIVELGKMILTPGTYDENFNVITEPTYEDGYFYDIMCEQNIDFGIYVVYPINIKHNFMGWESN